MKPFNDIIGCGCLAMLNCSEDDIRKLPAVRIGKDVEVSWPVFTNGGAQSFEGRDVLIVLAGPASERYEMPFRTEGNVIRFTFCGKDQRRTGLYAVIMFENYGKGGQSVIDQKAFVLVPHTDMEHGGENPAQGDPEVVSVDMRSGDISLGMGIPVDDAFSETSVNPVQNKVVTAAVNSILDQLKPLNLEEYEALKQAGDLQERVYLVFEEE